jgi:hypothetical protein
MRVLKLMEVDSDGIGGIDATEVQLLGASLTLLGVTGVTDTDQLFV